MSSLPIDCIQEGRNTVWPHNPQTGYSYCVMIPSWITQTPETGVTADSFLKSVVVSILSPTLSIHATDDSNTFILVAFHMPIGKCNVLGILLVIQQTKFLCTYGK